LSREDLTSNRLKQSAIVREIEIIGEAVKNISENLKEKHKEVEWKKIVGTRDQMIYHYLRNAFELRIPEHPKNASEHFLVLELI